MGGKKRKLKWTEPRTLDEWVKDAEPDIRSMAKEISGKNFSHHVRSVRKTVAGELTNKQTYARSWAKCASLLEKEGCYKTIGAAVGRASTVVDLGCGFANIRRYLDCDRYIGLDNNPFSLYQARRSFPDAFLFARARWGSKVGRLQFLPEHVSLPPGRDTYLILMELVYAIEEYFNTGTTTASEFLRKQDIGLVDCITTTFDGGASFYRTGATVTEDEIKPAGEGDCMRSGAFYNAQLILKKGGRMVRVGRTSEDMTDIFRSHIHDLDLEITRTEMHDLPREPESERLYIYGDEEPDKYFQIIEMVKTA